MTAPPPYDLLPCSYEQDKRQILVKKGPKRLKTHQKLRFYKLSLIWHSKPYFRPFRGPKFEKSRTLLVRARYLVYSPLWEILSILGYVLTSSLKFRVFFKKLMGSFFQFWAKLGFFLETFAFFPGKNLKFFGIFFLKMFIFQGKISAFWGKNWPFSLKFSLFVPEKFQFLVAFFLFYFRHQAVQGSTRV